MLNAHASDKPDNAAADMVNRPAHYNSPSGSSIEAIDAVQAQLTREQYIGWLHGNAAKYLWRWQHKGRPCQDLEKAQFFIKRLIDLQISD